VRRTEEQWEFKESEGVRSQWGVKDRS
jgi:hypothetical protein